MPGLPKGKRPPPGPVSADRGAGKWQAPERAISRAVNEDSLPRILAGGQRVTLGMPAAAEDMSAGCGRVCGVCLFVCLSSIVLDFAGAFHKAAGNTPLLAGATWEIEHHGK